MTTCAPTDCANATGLGGCPCAFFDLEPVHDQEETR